MYKKSFLPEEYADIFRYLGQYGKSFLKLKTEHSIPFYLDNLNDRKNGRLYYNPKDLRKI
jgi:hypothetical protein